MCSLQFREDDKQEGDILKLVLLGLDICASFLLTIISLSKHVKGSGLDLTDEAFASVIAFRIVGAIYASVIGGYYCRKLQQKTCSHGLLIGLGGLNSNISYLVLMVSIKGKISLCFDYSKFITGVHPFLNCNSCYTKL